jgi:hypothetical protein
MTRTDVKNRSTVGLAATGVGLLRERTVGLVTNRKARRLAEVGIPAT